MQPHSVPVIIIGAVLLGASATVCQSEDARSLTSYGGQMSSAEKTLLEEQVSKNPNDVEARTKLLGYYFIEGRRDPDAKAARQRHVSWLIENAPESEVLGSPYGHLDRVLDPNGYERAKESWLEVIEKSPENLSVLWNASKFFLLHDRELSEELSLRGQKLDPEDPKWAESLGHLYSLVLPSLPSGPARTAVAEKAFRQFELAYGLSESMKRDALLQYLAKTAFDAGLIDEARKFAEKMLDDDGTGWNRGNRVHHGNLILGRVALSEGDVNEAKSRLLLAGKTKGSPQLNSFGPNMLLAKELLERGESEVVLEYFELCKQFWTSPHRELEQWIDDVQANRIPEFKANLAY